MLSRRGRALLQQQLITIMIISMILIMVQKQLQDMVVAAADYNYYLIDCGNNNVDNSVSMLGGRNWSRDEPKYYSSSMAATAVDPDGSVFQIPFWTGRVSQANFTYKFRVSPGPQFIRLYFYSSTYYSSSISAGSSDSSITRDRFFFSVVSNTGAVLLQNFTAAKATTTNDSPSAKDPYIRLEFFLTTHRTTSFLELTFSPSLPSYYALVNGIEVVSASPNLLYRYSAAGRSPPPPSSVPRNIYELQNFSVGEWSSLETMYRVNVGGPELQPTNDSAGAGSGRMYRHWDNDDSKGYQVVGPGVPTGYRFEVNYSASSTPEYVAPAEVYMTGKEIGNTTESEEVNQRAKLNLTWMFEVDVGFSYFVRLHWCEFEELVNGTDQRVFSVYINNQMAEEFVDLMGTGWGNGSKLVPIYRDYAVYQEQGGDNHLLLSLRPVTQGFVNVMLNGVEIFKANKSDGILATPNSDPLQPTLLHNDSNSSHSYRHHHHLHLVVIIVVVVVVGIILLLSLLLFRGSDRFSIYGSITNKSTTSKYGTKTTTTTTNSSWWGLQRTYKGKNSSSALCSSSSKSLPSDLCRRFSLNQIRSATCDFSESLLIGSGGFGSVYRGTIDLINNNNIPRNNIKDDDCDDGDRGSNTTKPSSSVIQVAIKRLNQRTSKQGAREFITEIEMLSRLRHAHLVPLIGYCDDQGEMVLVYEYMPRGTLREHLNIVGQHHHHNPSPLSWERRLSICIGAAKGLHYLHTGARHMVIHRDVKSTNILLDHNWAAKVADFGLSKLVVPPQGGELEGEVIQFPQNGITTAVKGSFGYVDPEYFKRQHLTEKSDVYSFGVVLFEALCGRPAIDHTLPKDQVNLAMWARMCHRRGLLDQIMDPNLFNILNNDNNNNIISPSPVSLKKFGDIAEMCVRDQGIDRPSMADVLWGLELTLQLQTTSSSSRIPPAISHHHQIIVEDNCDQQYDHPILNLDDKDDLALLHSPTTTTTTTSSSTAAASNSTTITGSNSSHIVSSHLRTTTADHRDSKDGEDFTSGSVFSEIIKPQPR